MEIPEIGFEVVSIFLFILGLDIILHIPANRIKDVGWK